MKSFPKVLVISHNCFSKSGSNGRTLANLFEGWPKENLAQFFISSETPNSEVCNNYYRVTDGEAIKSLIIKNKEKRVEKKIINIEEGNKKKIKKIYQILKRKNSLNYISRNFIWNRNKWWNNKFDSWLKKNNPEVILIQLGDYSFMLKLALKIAKSRNIPIVIYSSEDYYFKDRKSLSPLYHYYRNDYKNQIKKIVSYSSYSIYNSKMLQETYNKEFKHKSSVIMTSTNISAVKDKEINQVRKISYLGNLGVGRHEPLIEIGNLLNSINPEIKLDIYGKVPSEKIKSLFESCNGINLKGFVSYNEVIEVMKTSDLLVHAENFSKFHRWDLKHAFSTKIADSLASGIPFLMYAPEELASTKYLLKNDIAFVVTKKKSLEKLLKELINTRTLKDKKSLEALTITKKNHSSEKNIEKFKKILKEVELRIS